MTLARQRITWKNLYIYTLPEKMILLYTLKLRWLKHWWLIYHGYFELVLEYLEFFPIISDINRFWIIRNSYFILKMFVVYTHKNHPNEAILMSTQHTSIFILKKIEKMTILCFLTWFCNQFSLALTTRLKLIFTVPKVFEPLKFKLYTGTSMNGHLSTTATSL